MYNIKVSIFPSFLIEIFTTIVLNNEWAFFNLYRLGWKTVACNYTKVAKFLVAPDHCRVVVVSSLTPQGLIITMVVYLTTYITLLKMLHYLKFYKY